MCIFVHVKMVNISMFVFLCALLIYSLILSAVNLAKSKFYKNKGRLKRLSRKEIRKNKRLEKKSNQNEFHRKKTAQDKQKVINIIFFRDNILVT